MSAHDHAALVPGCARCELSVDEAIAAATATSEPDRLAQIEARLSAATPGPWAVGKRNGAPASTLSILGPEREYDYGGDVVVRDHPVIADVWVGNAGNTGAELIAHAPADLTALLAVVKAVRTKAEGWAALAPDDDWGEDIAQTIVADAGRAILATLDAALNELEES